MVFPNQNPPLRMFYMGPDPGGKDHDVLYSAYSFWEITDPQALGTKWTEEGPVYWNNGKPVRNAQAAVIYRNNGTALCLFENARPWGNWKEIANPPKVLSPHMFLVGAKLIGTTSNGNLVFEEVLIKRKKKQVPIRMKPAPWDLGYITVPRATRLINGDWRIYYSGALCNNPHRVRSQISYNEGKTWTSIGENPSPNPVWIESGYIWPGQKKTSIDPCVVTFPPPKDDPTSTSKNEKFNYRMYTKVREKKTLVDFWDSTDGLVWDNIHLLVKYWNQQDQYTSTVPFEDLNDPVIVKTPGGRIFMYYHQSGSICYAEST